MPVDSPNVGVAFALVIGAGAATAVGAAVVFFPSLVKLASRRVLASALGISAGVMTYVSFVEIFQKSNGSFLDAGRSERDAYIYATLCFFGGVVVMLLIDVLVRCFSGEHHHHHSHDISIPHESNAGPGLKNDDKKSEEAEIIAPHCVGCSDDPVGELQEWHEKAEKEVKEHNNKSVTVASGELSGDQNVMEEGASLSDVESKADEFNDEDGPVVDDTPPNEHKKLVKMGISTAIAIGLHNFPEGLATFVAALDDPKVGGVLAVAIGIHNIPEGLCVALPIYYATGNRMKAFCWALISGLSEPIAALLGWAVLANSFSDELYAVLFGLVGGMMVMISCKELLPTAHRYDPDDTVVTYSFISGMVIMALSLVLFQL
uniref:Uncharacterized protein n=1 Tax=Helicotheca tamesis TaxID=374047 RepID=A0A7S2E0S1_9STRA|mmetsp:Transcript_11478/g.15931  ORF Transcript_11478/g.15931 Transcript_11478/m.15931 type:complete len:375 (+) Transcript_11478:201-1325(+)|eukprot:CAMPEP_0185736538 /NCGR_PEP_ID=MMETSP1171-20130828/28156_1 /TAXON_ID=374046 /ORGANISM="Helicotheca tamensis, Strain CCMP826" /LENGTH=374 /DNA_ID=CAMNT_0028407189 /DNA_START=154 /DNA_END=1278 /DNA_ORIENTATION=-